MDLSQPPQTGCLGTRASLPRRGRRAQLGPLTLDLYTCPQDEQRQTGGCRTANAPPGGGPGPEGMGGRCPAPHPEDKCGFLWPCPLSSRPSSSEKGNHAPPPTEPRSVSASRTEHVAWVTSRRKRRVGGARWLEAEEGRGIVTGRNRVGWAGPLTRGGKGAWRVEWVESGGRGPLPGDGKKAGHTGRTEKSGGRVLWLEAGRRAWFLAERRFVGGVLVGGGEKGVSHWPGGARWAGHSGRVGGTGAWWAGRVTCCPALGGASGARSRARAPEWLPGRDPPATRGVGGPRAARQVGPRARLVRTRRGGEQRLGASRASSR